MNNQKSIKVNFIMNSILKMSAFIFPLITYPYVSRILEPVGMGKVAFAASVVSYFSMFASMGIPTYGIRACAKVRDDKEKLSKTVQEIMGLNIIILAITYITFIICILNIEKMESYKNLLLINSISMILNVFGIEWVYTSLEEYTYISIRSLIFKIVSIILMFIFIHDSDDYIIYGIISIFSSVGSNIFNLINIRKFICFKRFSNYNIKSHIKPVLILFATSVAINIYTNLDTVMLGYMSSDFEVGLYSTAIKFKQILVSLVITLGVILLPRMSYYHENNEVNKINELLIKSIHFTLIISLGISIFFIFYSKECILLLAGEDYLGAVNPMIVITMTIPIIGLASIITNQILIPMNREKGSLIATSIGAIIDLILNAILIPKIGALGVSIATLGAEFIGVIIQIIFAKDILIPLLKKVPYRYTIASTLISLFFIYIVKLNINTSYFIELVIGGCIFFSSYILVLIFMKEPIMCNIINEFNMKIKKNSKKEKLDYEV